MKVGQNEYQRGYAAGRKRSEKDVKEAKALREQLVKIETAINERRDRIFMQSLDLALKHCDNWTIGGKPLNNAETYCQMANVFAENSIKILNSKSS